VYRIKKLKNGQGPTKGCTAIDRLISKRWENNIKAGHDGIVKWPHAVQGRVQWWALIKRLLSCGPPLSAF
jgi:hypothetical protein